MLGRAGRAGGVGYSLYLCRDRGCGGEICGGSLCRGLGLDGSGDQKPR